MIRRDSIRNSPIVISTRMITSAATSAVFIGPMYEPPPTISDIGNAIRWKLMIAPKVAITSTTPAIRNCVSEDDDRVRRVVSSAARMRS